LNQGSIGHSDGRIHGDQHLFGRQQVEVADRAVDELIMG